MSIRSLFGLSQRPLFLFGAGLACAGAALLVAAQPDPLLPADIQLWGSLAFTFMALGLALLSAVAVVQRRTR